jgi:hypothetical protein
MLTGRTGASIDQDQPSRVPPSRTRLESVANSSRGFGEGEALPREEFLYDFKRRLRAAAARPSSPPRTGAHGLPAFPRPLQHGPPCPARACLPAAWGGREGWESGGSTSRVRAPPLGPCTQTRTGRSSLAGRDARGPSLSRAGKKSVRPTAPLHQFRGLFSSSTPDRRRSVCARSTCRPAKGAPLRGYRPASEGPLRLT